MIIGERNPIFIKNVSKVPQSVTSDDDKRMMKLYSIITYEVMRWKSGAGFLSQSSLLRRVLGCMGVRRGVASRNCKCVEFLRRSGSGTDTWYLSPCRVSPHIPGNVAEPPHRCPQKRLEGVHGNRASSCRFALAITKSSMWAPRRKRAPSIVTVHMLFSNPTVAHSSFARKALMVACQALAAEGML